MANSITSRDLSITSTSYAGIYVYDGISAQTIATGTTPVLLTCFNQTTGFNGLFYDCTPVKTGNKITVTRAGVYKIAYSISFSQSGTNQVFELYAFNGGVQVAATGAQTKTVNNTDVKCCSAIGFATVAANTDIDLRGYHDAVGNIDMTVTHTNFVVMRVGN